MEPHFTYATYGQGTLPKEFQKKLAKKVVNVVIRNSYLHLSGALTKEKHLPIIGDLGYKAQVDRKIPCPFLALFELLNPLILISLAIFGLSFSALVRLSLGLRK